MSISYWYSSQRRGYVLLQDLELDALRTLSGDCTAFGATPAFAAFLEPDLAVDFGCLPAFASYFSSISELFFKSLDALFWQLRCDFIFIWESWPPLKEPFLERVLFMISVRFYFSSWSFRRVSFMNCNWSACICRSFSLSWAFSFLFLALAAFLLYELMLPPDGGGSMEPVELALKSNCKFEKFAEFSFVYMRLFRSLDFLNLVLLPSICIMLWESWLILS